MRTTVLELSMSAVGRAIDGCGFGIGGPGNEETVKNHEEPWYAIAPRIS